jgi:hypothetical protein
MKKVRFNNWQKGMMVAMPVAITMNPLTVEVFIEYIKWGFAAMSAIAVVYIVGFTLYQCFRPTEVKIPKDDGKSKKKLPKQLQYEV